MAIPRNHRQLWAFVGAHFNVYLPHRVYTPGHSSPFAFLADAFFHGGDDVAAWSCRSGGKTLVASILARLEHLLTEGLQGRVLSGSECQATHLYEYWTNWCHQVAPRQVRGPVSRLLTRINGGRLEILAASQKRVRGPKVQRLYADEVDEIAPEISEAAAGMLASRPGRPARTIYTSTWHRIGGPMGKLIAGCGTSGIRLHKWNLWEAIARCPPGRHQLGRGCAVCPLGEECLAKAREHFGQPSRQVGIAASARGIFAVEDAAKIWQKLSRQTVETEYLCQRPSPQGLVYYDFDETVHVRPEAPAHLTCYRAIDWGYNTFVCLWLGVTKDETVWLLDTYKAERSQLCDHAAYINAHPIQDVAATYCDPAGRSKDDQTGRSNVEEFRRHGIRCAYTLSRKWLIPVNGIHLIRSFLKPASAPARLFILDTPANRVFVEDIGGYVNRKINNEYVDEPVKPQPADHTMDALRYFFVNRMAGAYEVTVKGYGLA